MLFAYEAWMYDDGRGSNNVECTVLDRSGCWAHRYDILWRFEGTGASAMGAAAGVVPGGASGFTLVLVQYAPGYRRTYNYTWNEAVAAGAGHATDRLSCVGRRRAAARHRHRRAARCGGR